MLLLFSLLGVIAAAPPQILASYSLAVDFSAFASTSTFNCLRSAGYSVAFVRGYNPVGSGSFDNNSVTNIKNAYSAGLGTEVYMTPQPLGNKTASQQFDELYNGLSSRGIAVRSLWFQVTSPRNWGSNVNTNKNFISSLIVKAQNKAITPGVYTSQNEWNTITGNWTSVPSGTQLWYWNINGTSSTFTDFRPFGGFSSATVKQYSQGKSVCSLAVNLDSYLASSVAYDALEKKTPADNTIRVGGYVIT